MKSFAEQSETSYRVEITDINVLLEEIIPHEREGAD